MNPDDLKNSWPNTTPVAPEAIASSRGITLAEAAEISDHLARSGNYSRVIILAMDIRQSTTFMLHVEDFAGYARILAAFVAFVRQTAATTGAWFDKFTGDGAHLFWTVPTGDSVEGTLDHVLAFASTVQCHFIQSVIPSFRTVAGCIPERFGLSIGIDGGRCLITHLTHDSPLQGGAPAPGCKSVDDVAVFGRAVVGAVRMVSAAGPHETLLNEGPGELLARTMSATSSARWGGAVHRVLVENKDLRGRQFAYQVALPAVQESLREYCGLPADGGAPT